MKNNMSNRENYKTLAGMFCKVNDLLNQAKLLAKNNHAMDLSVNIVDGKLSYRLTKTVKIDVEEPTWKESYADGSYNENNGWEPS